MTAAKLDSCISNNEAISRAVIIINEFRAIGRAALYAAYHTGNQPAHTRLCLRVLIHYATSGGNRADG
jgi:hypothetical protein